jgi:hypothetical protein
MKSLLISNCLALFSITSHKYSAANPTAEEDFPAKVAREARYCTVL